MARKIDLINEKLFLYDGAVAAEGYRPVCGVDEAGRGPLAGRVYAAAAVLPEGVMIPGLDDSKKISEKNREALYDVIMQTAVDFCVAFADEKEIDEMNILEASMLAMRRAAAGLGGAPGIFLVDGNRHPQIPGICRPVVKGDSVSAAIAAASVLAKVSRDRHMRELAAQYPGYGFEKHKGYPTREHYAAIEGLGICPAHRKSFLKSAIVPAENAGYAAEEAAARFLGFKGYTILARNFRVLEGEIDIIAFDCLSDDTIFIEVKQRKDDLHGRPEEFVDAAKREKLKKAALRWIESNDSDGFYRFDVIAISGKKITHIKNAFEM